MYLFSDLLLLFDEMQGLFGGKDQGLVGYFLIIIMKIIVVLVLLGFINALEDWVSSVPIVSYEIFVPEIQAYDAASSLFPASDEQIFKQKVDR